MHFRKLIMTGIIAGSALFLPELALAEKAPEAKRSVPPSAAVQDKLPLQAEKAKAADKITAQPAVKKQQPEKKPVIEKPVIEKPVIKKPVQAKAVVHTPQVKQNPGKSIANSKSEKAKRPVLSEKASGEKANPKNIAKQNNTANKKAAATSIHKKYEEVKDTNRPSTGLKDEAEPAKAIAEKQGSLKKPAAKANVQASPEKKKKTGPSQKVLFPKGDNLPNPPSRTKASGGPSSDRSSNGSSSISFLDKWFIWNQGFDLNLTQPFTSRASVFISQWVNAPPSPPPNEAPVFLAYTEGISHG